MTTISGVWLPLITPFKDGAVDLASYERLVAHYVSLGVDALFPLGTTGESPTLDHTEHRLDVADVRQVGQGDGRRTDERGRDLRQAGVLGPGNRNRAVQLSAADDAQPVHGVPRW